MRVARLAAVAVGVCGLVAASAGSGSGHTLGLGSRSGTQPSGSASALADVIVQPGAVRLGLAPGGPPSTGGMEGVH